MGGRAAGGHAQPGDLLLAEQQQVRGGQFLRGDDGAGRQVIVCSFAQQDSQHLLPEVTQVVGTLGQQWVAEIEQDLALRFDRLVPGVTGGLTGFDGVAGGIQ